MMIQRVKYILIILSKGLFVIGDGPGRTPCVLVNLIVCLLFDLYNYKRGPSRTVPYLFGGAYAVLAYIAQQSVQNYAWLKPGEMLDGLGLAETKPGPLIQVVQFVAFLGAYRHAGNMSPMLAGILGSIITTWVTFVPSFLWIFTGAPYIEKLRKIPALHSAMKAITASVVGVILNLSIWFALHTLFQTVTENHYSILRLYVPDWHTFDFGTAIIMIYALVMVFRYKAGLFTVLGTSILFGFMIKGILML